MVFKDLGHPIDDHLPFVFEDRIQQKVVALVFAIKTTELVPEGLDIVSFAQTQTQGLMEGLVLRKPVSPHFQIAIGVAHVVHGGVAFEGDIDVEVGVVDSIVPDDSLNGSLGQEVQHGEIVEGIDELLELAVWIDSGIVESEKGFLLRGEGEMKGGERLKFPSNSAHN